jgi:hypothetical protein
MERLLGAHASPSLACYCGCTYLEEFLEDHQVGCCAGGGGEDQILRLFPFLKNTCMSEFDLKAKLIGYNGQDSQIRVNYIDQ